MNQFQTLRELATQVIQFHKKFHAYLIQIEKQNENNSLLPIISAMEGQQNQLIQNLKNYLQNKSMVFLDTPIQFQSQNDHEENFSRALDSYINDLNDLRQLNNKWNIELQSLYDSLERNCNIPQIEDFLTMVRSFESNEQEFFELSIQYYSF